MFTFIFFTDVCYIISLLCVAIVMIVDVQGWCCHGDDGYYLRQMLLWWLKASREWSDVVVTITADARDWCYRGDDCWCIWLMSPWLRLRMHETDVVRVITKTDVTTVMIVGACDSCRHGDDYRCTRLMLPWWCKSVSFNRWLWNKCLWGGWSLDGCQRVDEDLPHWNDGRG